MPPFLLISVSVLTASFFGFLASLFRQPLIIGYIFAGLILSLLGVFSGENRGLFENMAHLGITFLLFLVGLEMNIKELGSIGKVALYAGVGQIIFTLVIGFLLTLLLGYGAVPAFYLTIALTFSSTIIGIKLLSEKKDLTSLYGKIAVGLLLVQDLVVILLLVFLSGFAAQTLTFFSFFAVLVKGLSLLLAVYLLSKFALPRVFLSLATMSQELLFLAAISWALILSSVVSLPWVGFLPEIGGFLAGLALANSSEHLQIASRVKPLRDFFIPAFFLLLGAQMTGISFSMVLVALVFSLFVLVGKPLVILLIMGALGYKSRTSFLASITLAQISEFSFIVVALGQKLGHILPSEVGLVALVGAITMTVSTYLISGGHVFYQRARSILRRFERKMTKETAFLPGHKLSGHTVLIGVGRTGGALLPVLKRNSDKLLIVDFNPDVVERLSGKGFSVMYGDTQDAEALELLNLPEAKYVISTVNSLDDNLVLLEKIKKLHRRPLVILTASTPQDGLALYSAGADYVVVPRVVSGEHLADLFSAGEPGKERLAKLHARHFERLARERF